MTWERGAATIRDLIAGGQLQRVPASHEQAEALIATAQRHLVSANAVGATDPDGAYSMLYDAGRKALAAILANQIEYPAAAAPEVSIDEVEADIPKVEDLIEVARKSLPQMGPF